MEKKFSTKWKGSKQPRKQRKYAYNAPLHIKGKLLTACLAKELVKKHSAKKLRIKLGDKVRVMRGKFKGKEGKVDVVNIKKSTAYITGIEFTKKDGSKGRRPIHASNIMIIDLNTDDKNRLPRKTDVKKE